MQDTWPLVSIVTPTYNRASFLEETIESVLSQDYPRIEYIVLDDGSTDETPAMLKKYEGRLRYVRHDNMGETLTVNKGLQMATGEIVCGVNSDDPLLPGAIRSGVSALQADPEALVAYGDWREIGPQSEFIRDFRLPDYTLENMLMTFRVSMGPGGFIRRRAFDVVGYRDPKRKYTGDFEFWFRIALHSRLIHVPAVLATHRTHPGAASSTIAGARVAAELVSTVRETCRSPLLPEALRRKRRQIMGNAYHVVLELKFCGASRRRRLWYRLASILYDPKRLLECSTP